MSPTVRWVLGLLTAFAVGAGLGGYVMDNVTTRIMIDRAVDRDAAAVRRYVAILERMREGEPDEATELLESWLDDTLIVVMEPSNYAYRIQTITAARADSAYLATRAYRDAFPRTSNRSFVDNMVAHVWEAGLPSQLP